MCVTIRMITSAGRSSRVWPGSLIISRVEFTSASVARSRVRPGPRGRLLAERLDGGKLPQRRQRGFFGIASRHHCLPVHLRADRVFELAQDRRKTKPGQWLAQLILGEAAAEGDQAAQALVCTRVDVQQGRWVGTWSDTRRGRREHQAWS